MSHSISHLTCIPAYTPFTPSKSGQRLPPTYYRGCWHVVSRGLFFGYRHFSSPIKEVYDPKTFILHAASLHQGFPHCAIFPTAASRRSLGRVSVPMWPFSLSARLPIVALVVHYTTNQLIGRGSVLNRPKPFLQSRCHVCIYAVLAPVSRCCPPVKGWLPTRYSPVRYFPSLQSFRKNHEETSRSTCMC